MEQQELFSDEQMNVADSKPQTEAADDKGGKLYYSMKEVGEMLDLNHSNIRYWESEFPTRIKPVRNKRGVRMFRQSDIDMLKEIKHLTQDCNYTLEGVRKYLKHQKLRGGKQDVLAALIETRDFLTELRDSMRTGQDKAEE